MNAVIERLFAASLYFSLNWHKQPVLFLRLSCVTAVDRPALMHTKVTSLYLNVEAWSTCLNG